ncbi:MAG TPA: RNA polymerase factor sigma-54 [Dongiaceae bacterium]
MAVSQRLDLRQAQSLVMTPQLQQAIKLLELSNQDLAAYVEEELERNPLLERADESEADGLAEAPSADGDPDRMLDAKEFGDRERLPDAKDSPIDADYDNVYTGNGAGEGSADFGAPSGQANWRVGAGRGDFPDEDGDFQETLSRELTLREHLEQQLGIEVADPTERLVGLQIIDLIDDAGYVQGDLAALAERLGCPFELVEAVLRKLQQFDPVGVAARTLAECLALQLKERDRLDPAMQAMLDHLDLLAKHDRAQLMKVCGVDAEDLADMAAEIRSLNPRPGHAFDRTEVQAIQPDIMVHRLPDGSWSVELNSDNLPRLLVNQQYHARVTTKAQSKTDKDYLADRLSAANWLVKTLHQRATTILKVASEIVRQQEMFFLHGVKHLKPLIRRDIADAIGMHESTVSRVTANKFMATPRGLFELRYFFSAAIQAADGADSHSAEAVRSRIRELIDKEPMAAVMSDDQLVAVLKVEGVDIARRTVAKYRESLRIPSSVQRRREKSLRSA